MTDLSFTELYKPYQAIVEKGLAEHMALFGPSLENGRAMLREACEYALMNGGKRFRPALSHMVADALNFKQNVTTAALAIEYFHTASLIADDLPCMDDDDERRCKPSLHKVFGEATALLASYALIAAGYGLIATAVKNLKAERQHCGIEALSNAAFNTGVFGATGGQLMDIYPKDLSLETLRETLHKKTVSLFEISFVFGWIFGGGDLLHLDEVKKCASHYGMAFQIADDLGDVEQDVLNGRKINIAGVFGVEVAQKMLASELLSYRSSLEKLRIASPQLLALASILKVG